MTIYYTCLSNSKNNNMMGKIYKCGNNPLIKDWLRLKYEDLIVTIKIFAKFSFKGL